MITRVPLRFSVAVLILVAVLGSCATPQPGAGSGVRTGASQPVAQTPAPPAADDWTTEYLGTGSVRTTIENATTSDLFLKVRRGSAAAAQARLTTGASRDFFLAPGSYDTVMEIRNGGSPAYYSGPNFSLPPNAAVMMLRLEGASSSNLTRISRREFESTQ